MIKNKKVFVLGLGKSGFAASLLLAKSNKVVVTDQKKPEDKVLNKLKRHGIKVVITDDPFDMIDKSFDLIVKNPGIKYDHKCLIKARNLGIKIINEMELAYYYLPKDVKIIGVTGSNGKTTTVNLIYNMLLEAGKKAFLCGNVGTAISGIVKDVKKGNYLVVEISDHQLCDMYKFKTNVSVLLNIYDAHTDFHDSHEKYKMTKKRIFNNHSSRNIAIINKDNKECLEITSDIKSTKRYFSKKSKNDIYIDNNSIYYKDEKIIDIDDIKIKGEHNLENIMASILAVKEYNIKTSAIKKAIKDFNGIEHRIEFVDNINGVSYYNDSKSTNTESTITALKSFNSPIVLLLGGLDRGHSFEPLKKYLKNVKYIAAFGETNKRIYDFAKSLNIKSQAFNTLKEALDSTKDIVKAGDVVLLSPACASWDQYDNFEIRGNEFKDYVKSYNSFDLKEHKNIYMIGIGGISMSGIAQILKKWKYNVSGSNNVPNPFTEKLIKEGIKVNYSQVSSNIETSTDLVIYTAAISEDNEELIKAKKLGIKTISRGEFLGELTKLYKDTIGIAGTHGKTTTTSMVSSIFLKANLDPTIQVGSYLDLIKGNYKVGNSEHFIIEACEYKDSYLSFHQKSAIILNIDDDHLDYFKNIDNICKSFQAYVSSLPQDGYLVLNKDDKRVYNLRKYTKAKVITIGSSKADFVFKNVTYDENGHPSYDIYCGNKKVDTISLNINGIHNIYNSLCAYALSKMYKIDSKYIKEGLSSFKGAARRMDLRGVFHGANVYDDYGHHPTEIKATYDGIKHMKYNKTFVIFEPHTYSRLKAHLKDFAAALVNFDNIIITDIYAAREKNIYNISENDLIKEIKKLGKDAIHISSYEDIKKYLEQKVETNDIIVAQGAGNINELSEILLK